MPFFLFHCGKIFTKMRPVVYTWGCIQTDRQTKAGFSWDVIIRNHTIRYSIQNSPYGCFSFIKKFPGGIFRPTDVRVWPLPGLILNLRPCCKRQGLLGSAFSTPYTNGKCGNNDALLLEAALRRASYLPL